MKETILSLFSELDNENIDYYLLRPLCLDTTVVDVDIVISEENTKKIFRLLTKHRPESSFRQSRARKTIQVLYENKILLDIKYQISFLSSKSLLVNGRVPYSKTIFLSENLLSASVDKEIFFTFWTLHLFLDKKTPNKSTSFNTYRKLYADNWEFCLKSDYFRVWTTKIFGENQILDAEKLLFDWFSKGATPDEPAIGRKLKGLLFSHNQPVKFRYLFDKLRCKSLRWFKIYDKFKPIK